MEKASHFGSKIASQTHPLAQHKSAMFLEAILMKNPLPECSCYTWWSSNTIVNYDSFEQIAVCQCMSHASQQWYTMSSHIPPFSTENDGKWTINRCWKRFEFLLPFVTIFSSILNPQNRPKIFDMSSQNRVVHAMPHQDAPKSFQAASRSLQTAPK